MPRRRNAVGVGEASAPYIRRRPYRGTAARAPLDATVWRALVTLAEDSWRSWRLDAHGASPGAVPLGDGRRGSASGRQRVDGDRDREDRAGRPRRGRRRRRRVAHAKPLLGDRRDRVAVALDLVLVVDDVPWAFMSAPCSTSIAKRSRIPTSALWTVAAVSPPRSIAILSRMLSLRSWIRATSSPGGVLEHERLPEAKRLAVDLVGPLAARSRSRSRRRSTAASRA